MGIDGPLYEGTLAIRLVFRSTAASLFPARTCRRASSPGTGVTVPCQKHRLMVGQPITPDISR